MTGKRRKIKVAYVPSAHTVPIFWECELYAIAAIREHHDDLIFGNDEEGQHGRN